ncbi:UNKNOWN [Stylonychia lemnae]|uniref:C2H2-type domain-containing protein n=1 Tax=Stylonychia lemnae TaxID=5949 RepID=A0A077ZTS9_STYLE|nr:UNKNOWN [Stylonychia lemnae]|eukprot:CDW72730.1 UNKNOWN [Stylonychia lemnae]
MLGNQQSFQPIQVQPFQYYNPIQIQKPVQYQEQFQFQQQPPQYIQFQSSNFTTNNQGLNGLSLNQISTPMIYNQAPIINQQTQNPQSQFNAQPQLIILNQYPYPVYTCNLPTYDKISSQNKLDEINQQNNAGTYQISCQNTNLQTQPQRTQSTGDCNASNEETIDDGIKRKLGLPLSTQIRVQEGIDLELNSVQQIHVPAIKTFKYVKYYKESNKRWLQVFICEYNQCSKTFNKWHNLFDHLRSHINERPYICPVDKCSQPFTQKSNLNKHMKTHKNKYYLKCSECKEHWAKSRILEHFKVHKNS